MRSNQPDNLPLRLHIPEDVSRHLSHAGRRCGIFGGRIHWLSTTTSTNDVAARLADLGAPEGTVVVAEAQTAGRGRMGRIWFSPPGAGLYISVVLRPLDGDAPDSAALLTIAAGAAAAEGLQVATGLPIAIKWPNDLMVAKRKLGGILAEGTSQGGRLQFVILGLGMNLRPAAYPPDLADRATSIEAEMDRPADRGMILAEILAALDARYADLREGRFDAILSAWRGRAGSLRGSIVEWDTPDGLQRGRVQDIDRSGALLVDTNAGPERLIAGEIRWI